MQISMLKSLLLATLASVTTSGLADDTHDPAVIMGDGIELHYVDHAAAGVIAGLPVYFAPKNTGFGADLTVRTQGLTQLGSLTRSEEGTILGGLTIPATETSAERTVAFVFVSADTTNNIIHFTLNGLAGKATITSDGMDGNHYINPVYQIVVGDKEASFKLEGGEACLGCSMRIVYAITSVLSLKDLL